MPNSSNSNNNKPNSNSSLEVARSRGRALEECRDNPHFKELVAHQFAQWEEETLALLPNDSEGFTALAYKRQGLFDVLFLMDNAILEGDEAKDRLTGDFKEEPSPFV